MPDNVSCSRVCDLPTPAWAARGGVSGVSRGEFGRFLACQCASITLLLSPGTVQVRLFRSYNFEAAHQLPNVPVGHKCARVHGHSFGVEIVIKGSVDPRLGWCMDYGEIDGVWQPLYAAFDHHFLNEIPGLENPTSENLARYIWDYFTGHLAGLERVIVMETREARCEYEGI